MAFQPDLKALSREGTMLNEHGLDLSSGYDGETMRKPLIAVFPHPLHGRLIERVVLMVNHMINYKGCRYIYSWRNSGEVYYTPLPA
jgi:hypothetical protein